MKNEVQLRLNEKALTDKPGVFVPRTPVFFGTLTLFCEADGEDYEYNVSLFPADKKRIKEKGLNERIVLSGKVSFKDDDEWYTYLFCDAYKPRSEEDTYDLWLRFAPNTVVVEELLGEKPVVRCAELRYVEGSEQKKMHGDVVVLQDNEGGGEEKKMKFRSVKKKAPETQNLF